MSYTFALWYGEAPEKVEEAAAFLASFQETQEGVPPNPKLQSLISDLLAKYPESDEDDEDFDEDAWVWSDAPLMDNITGDVAVLGLSSDHVDEVMPGVLDLVAAHNVNFLDWQTGRYIRGTAKSS